MRSSAGRIVVVIRGGSRGLGMAIASRCLREGYIVATYSRSVSPFVKKQLVDDIVEVVLFMISPSASFITGQTIVFDGGLTC
jgi:NAD(P)-dependent dehydrogenase (short-subunit alcohol dehydrogenase family)